MCSRIMFISTLALLRKNPSIECCFISQAAGYVRINAAFKSKRRGESASMSVLHEYISCVAYYMCARSSQDGFDWPGLTTQRLCEGLRDYLGHVRYGRMKHGHGEMSQGHHWIYGFLEAVPIFATQGQESIRVYHRRSTHRLGSPLSSLGEVGGYILTLCIRQASIPFGLGGRGDVNIQERSPWQII